MDKVCTFLIGAPGAGKSTWLRNQEWIEDTYIASTDDIIETIADQYGFTYDEIFKDTIGLAEKIMWHELTLSAKAGNTIYIDRTNMSVKSRKRYIEFLQPYGYTFNAVVFPNPDPIEWERRLNSRPGKTIPENIIRSMVSSFRFPTKDEGFSYIYVEEPEYTVFEG